LVLEIGVGGLQEGGRQQPAGRRELEGLQLGPAALERRESRVQTALAALAEPLRAQPPDLPDRQALMNRDLQPEHLPEEEVELPGAGFPRLRWPQQSGSIRLEQLVG